MTSQSVQAQHSQDTVFRKFLERYSSYRQTEALDQLRLREYSRLDKQDQTYLDYTGGCPYPACLVDHHRDLLQRSVLGNPHSGHHAATASARLQQQAREDVLRYFNADPAEYLVIFTANASAALRLVAESYPFDEHGEFLLTADNHNSVNGIREYALRKGAAVKYIPCAPESLRVDDITPYLSASAPEGNRLLAYPAQSNFSGLQHPLAWISTAHAAGYEVLLDAAAFVPTNRLDLTRIRPDYVALSFYKMFGYPTGIGALIARKRSLDKLVRPSFSGGTVKMVSTRIHAHALQEGAAAFEDGTVDYLGFPAVSAGLHFLDAIGIETIHRRVAALAEYLLDRLQALRHANGRAAVEIYGARDMSRRGGTIAFNMRDPAGTYLDYAAVERLAGLQGISLRSGCFCNPGAAEAALSHDCIPAAERLRQTMDPLDPDHYRDCLLRHGKTLGAVRASLGMGSDFRDACRLIEFLADLLDRPAAEFAPPD